MRDETSAAARRATISTWPAIRASSSSAVKTGRLSPASLTTSIRSRQHNALGRRLEFPATLG